MARKFGIVASGLAVVCVLAGCSSAPTVSDTGYVGTWQRGNDEVRSFLSIVKKDDGYLFRWTLKSADGRRQVSCDWSGYCTELSDGELRAEHWFETSVNPENDRIKLDVRVKYHGDDAREDRFVEELVVRKEGLELRAVRERFNDEVYEGRSRPRWIFKKYSDDVADPPA